MALDSELEAEGKRVHDIVSAFYRKIEPIFAPQDVKPVPAGFEDSSDLVKGPEVTAYHYYPFLFAEEFPQVAIENVRQVAVAGQFYAERLLLQDKLIDEQMGEQTLLRHRAFLSTALLHEESLAILHSLFSSDSPFWRYLAGYHQEFAQAVFLERVKHLQTLSPYSEEEMRSIARGKSALAKASPTALAVLAGDGEKIEPLTTSQDFVAVAYQLYDDLQDWKKDYQRKNHSYLLTKIILEHGFETDLQAGAGPDAKTIGQILYYSGLAEGLLEEADHFYQEALHSVEGLNCPYWVKYVQRLQANCRRLKTDLSDIRKKTRSIYQRASREESVPLPLALSRAIHFLEESQSSEGYWSDFRNSAGESREWVTGYVGTALSRAGGNVNVSSKARDWITNNQFPEGGWGYHRGVVVDADSTSWCLQFLAGMGNETETRARAIEILKIHQSATDGGFRTYSAPDSIRKYMRVSDDIDCSGWCSSQTCVTGVALQTLLTSGGECAAKQIQGALEYIRRQQDESGCWEAYWWDGRMYSTYHCAKALRMAGTEEDERYCQRASRWLLSIQLEEGSWHNGIAGVGRPFYTALAVQALLETGGEPAWEAASRGVRWLLHEQVTDGSWQSYPMLRIPYPWTRCPWKESAWREENEGTGIIVRDQHRLFTTATVLMSLVAYQTVAAKVGLDRFE